MLVAYGGRSYLHSLQIFLSVETEETERSGFPKACSTKGKTLLSITGWSANHSAKAPGGGTVQNLGVVSELNFVCAFTRLLQCIHETCLTYSEHHRVCKLDIVDADSGDEADQAWDDIRVVYIYRLCYGLEAIQ